MKLTVLLLIVTVLQTNATASAQRITYSGENTSIESAFKEIRKQTGYEFLYNSSALSSVKNVNLHLTNVPLTKALDELFKDENLTYAIEGKTIIVKERAAAPDGINAGGKTILQHKIEGRVIDSLTGDGLAGVSVRIVGSDNGTVADESGYFTLEVDDDDVLEFSFLGYQGKRVSVNGRNSIEVYLNSSMADLEQLVVVGYGTQKKKELTGAVSQISGEELKNRPIANLANGIQGLLPGLTITAPSGQPGSPKNSFSIRGVNTINSSSSPLILIDGVAGGDLNLVNPDDVESITVLKDAASAAIYGARAANGVILVTTKTGKGTAHLTYSGNFGIQVPTYVPELVNGMEYMVLSDEARKARGVAIPYLASDFQKYESGEYPNDFSNTDWVNEIYKDFSTQQSHQIGVSGGSDESSYYFSYGYLNADGLIVGDGYKSDRNNFRLRLTTTLFDRLKIDGNLNYVDYKRKDVGGSGTGGVFRLSQRISPLLPVMWMEEDSLGGFSETPYWSYGSVANPVRTAYESGYTNTNSRTFNGIFNGTLNLLKGLDIKALYSYNYYTQDIKAWTPTQPRFLPNGTPHPANDDARNGISERHRSILTQTFNSTINYENDFGLHHLKVLGGFSQEWAYLPSISASRKEILLDGVEVLDVGTEDIQNSGTASHWAIRSYFGRLNYNYNEKYLFEADFRYDGTSRFARENRWGLFPSFSAGWNFSQEEFMDFSNTFLTLGRVRASWGELGNQDVGSSYYPYLVEIERETKSYPIGGEDNVGFRQAKIPNERIKWETIRMIDVGLDLHFVENQLELSLDWFKKKNMNALLRPVFPSVVGRTSASELPLENIGSIDNKGFEIEVTWRDKIGEVGYEVSANLSDASNKVTNLGNSAPVLGDNIRREGDPINAYYGYLTDGLAQVDDFEGYDKDKERYYGPKFPVISAYEDLIQPGDVKYRDISGENDEPDGTIDENDKVVFGNPFPRYSYSLRGAVNWRNFNLSFFLQGVGKANGYIKDEARHAFLNDYSIPKKFHTDRWTPDNTDATYPRMYYQPDHNIVFSNYWLEDASYLRLKNVQLGYVLPSKISKKFFVNRMNVYVSMENVMTLTRFLEGYDPELRETSGDAYPQVKTYSVGINLEF